MKQRSIVVLAVLAGISLVLGLILPGCTGLSLVRRTVVEKLNSPVQVHDLRADGLITADGRVIHLRFVKEIPTTNAIFAAAISSGIEIAADGKIVGLIDVHHWCGNDPIGEHLGRVDLAALAIYLGAGTTEDTPVLLRELGRRPLTGDRIDPGDYGSIRMMAMYME